ncbi:protein YIPF2-like [Durio zibethinus]|uniref:Protein YIPF2-like n=1 Tax=Durio zibethinus TaxID=66656 RepID=A0A6P5Z6K9_DURZI|nr:protein YIPF2-like [Durio zibethinus]
MEESSYSNLATTHLLGSVPAVVNEEKKASYAVPGANMQIFPPNNGGGGGGGRGYQTLGAPTEVFEQQPPNNWKGVFSISSYTQYFNVDIDVVINRLISSFYPVGGDFFSKIDANPDLYGLIWVTATLVSVLRIGLQSWLSLFQRLIRKANSCKLIAIHFLEALDHQNQPSRKKRNRSRFETTKKQSEVSPPLLALIGAISFHDQTKYPTPPPISAHLIIPTPR